MNTYSLFILKPGFTDKFKELNKVLVENKIKIEDLKKCVLPIEKIEKHYKEHKGKPFYESLVRYMTEGDVKGIYKFNPECIVMVVSSEIEETEKEFIERTRKLVKEVLRPSLALSREKYKILSDEEFNQLTTTANVIHASDSPESAQEEILNLF